MGVQGLWQLVEPAGKPVDVKSLKGKVLAVDASMWLHQLLKGFKDKEGNSLPNAHLLGVFYRVCKLLTYGIKPVFVFDGGVPILKRQTLAGRRQRKLEALDKSEEVRQKLLSNYLRQQIQRGMNRVVLPEEIEDKLEEGPSGSSPSTSPRKRSSPTKKLGGDKFQEIDEELVQFRERFLAQIEPDVDRVDKTVSKVKDEDEESSEDEDWSRRKYGMDYHENFSVILSSDFDSLPLETQHEILFEMQESRKMNSWGKMEQMPSCSQDFSTYQMDRLVKRRFLQKKIQSVQQEMGKRHIHVQNLDELLQLDYNFDSDELVGSQEKGFVLVKKGKSGVKDVGEEKGGVTTDTKTKEELSEIIIQDSGSSSENDEDDLNNKGKALTDLEEEEQVALAIQMSLEEESNKGRIETSKSSPPIKLTSIINDKKSPMKSMSSIPSAIANCSRFFDTVGISGDDIVKISNSSNKEQNETELKACESDDHDDDEFEEVEEKEDLRDPKTNEDERKMVDSLLKKYDKIPEESSDSNPNGITIDLSQIAKNEKVPEEDDLFTDIFKDSDLKVSSKSTTRREDEKITEVDKGEPAQDQEIDDEWGSDPEIEEIEELEQTTNQLKNSSESQASPTKTRTLGRMPEQSKPLIITAEYLQAQEKYNKEQQQLHSEKGFQERAATSLTDQIGAEAREVLELFGIPYVVSPMEAESQCAFLDVACLTDGTITDDSDCWLFGSRRVYKNFYLSGGGKKNVEFYQMADIVSKLNLDRDKLILVALLSGGDYSDGIEGVGPVTALEIISEFHINGIDAFEVLVKFREWWDLINDSNVVVPPDLPRIREKLRKLRLTPGFPSRSVYDAYINPTIDQSTEPFHWRDPDFEAIRNYTNKKFGWTQEKCDSMLLPLKKSSTNSSDTTRQLTLDSFVVSKRLESAGPSSKRKKGSKRVQSALRKLGNLSVHLPGSSNELALSSEEEEEECIEEPQTKTVNQSNNKRKRLKSPEASVSPGSSPKSSSDHPSPAQPKNPKIPQKLQDEAQQALNKRKAIEIFKKRNKKP